MLRLSSEDDLFAPLLVVCSYALGMVLFALFSGIAHPWDTPGRVHDWNALVPRLLGGTRPDLTTLLADAPAALSSLIERCWANDPFARPTANAIVLEITLWPHVRFRAAGLPSLSFRDREPTFTLAALLSESPGRCEDSSRKCSHRFCCRLFFLRGQQRLRVWFRGSITRRGCSCNPRRDYDSPHQQV